MTQQPDGKVEVIAYLTHYGHECHHDHISIPKNEQMMLKGTVGLFEPYLIFFIMNAYYESFSLFNNCHLILL